MAGKDTKLAVSSGAPQPGSSEGARRSPAERSAAEFRRLMDTTAPAAEPAARGVHVAAVRQASRGAAALLAEPHEGDERA